MDPVDKAMLALAAFDLMVDAPRGRLEAGTIAAMSKAATQFDRGRQHELDGAELIYQHLDAYLEEAAFPDRWNARTIMLT